MEIDEMLSNWGCEALIETFRSNDITMEVLEDLTPELIKELIPSIGLRIKFLKKFHDMFKNNKEDLNKAVRVMSPSDEGIITIESDTPANSSFESDQQQFIIVPAENSQVSFNSQEEIFIEHRLPEFELGALLKSSLAGRRVLSYYKTNGRLDESQSNRLCDIIIKHIFDYILKHRLVPREYQDLTNKIIDLFPNEKAGRYYVPALSKHDTPDGRAILAKGKLVSKAKNLIHQVSDVIPNHQRKRKRVRPSDEDFNETSADEFSDVDVEEKYRNDILFLQTRSEPWAEVIDRWNKTFPCRKIGSEETSVSAFIEKWPILKDLRAPQLINLDFDKLYPDKTLKLFEKWQKCFQKIIDYRQPSNIKDEFTLQLLNIINDDDVTEDNKFAVQLMLLPLLIPPTGRRVNTTTKAVWKYSAAEALDAIVCHAKRPGDVETIIDKQKEKAASNNIRVQPYLILEGNNLTQINNTYIIIDTLRYQFNSPKQAFDTCFKIFHVLDAKYPPQAEHIFLIIQQGIYAIHTKFDKIIPSAKNIIDILGESG